MSDYGVGALGGVVLIDPETGLPYKAEGGGGAVESVNGKTGAVVLDAADVGALPDDTTLLQIGTTASTAKAGNYQPTWAQVTSKPAAFPPEAHTHDAADVTSGTFATARIPNLSISKVTNLQASLDAKQDLLPVAPETGTFALQAVDGVLQWTEVV